MATTAMTTSAKTPDPILARLHPNNIETPEMNCKAMKPKYAMEYERTSGPSGLKFRSWTMRSSVARPVQTRAVSIYEEPYFSITVVAAGTNRGYAVCCANCLPAQATHTVSPAASSDLHVGHCATSGPLSVPATPLARSTGQSAKPDTIGATQVPTTGSRQTPVQRQQFQPGSTGG